VSNDRNAVIVGSGPNGLAAGIALAQSGWRVRVHEAASTWGGGARSAALTLPGFTHDICSTVLSFAAVSPFFRSLPLSSHGLEFVEPPISLAHPLDDGTTAVIERSVERTAARLGPDGDAYRQWVEPVIAGWPKLEAAILGPLRWPRHPWRQAKFGWHALQPAAVAARAFSTPRAKALLGGIAAHGMLPLDERPSAGFALVLASLAHTQGWTVAKGGTQRLSDALAAHLRQLGGRIVLSSAVESIDDVAPWDVCLCDLSPRPFLRVAGHRLPVAFRRKLQRFRYGMGVFKVDWALDAPIPWRSEECAHAGTVHLGGTYEEIARSESEAWNGRCTDRPFVILVQPTVFDSSRAPSGKHTAWAYCHVPRGSTADMLPHIEAQIERFAPGFRERVLARSVMAPRDIEQHNPNFVGGDIGAGVADIWQFFTRPSWRMYATPVSGLYLCSASTPPGVGVHGMCGYHAAELAMRDARP
jgi:phytoene dehydrogenase-like protein